MADVYAFPTEMPSQGCLGTSTVADDRVERPDGVPDDMWFAVQSVRTMHRIPGVQYREVPVPSSLADFGIGVEIECRTSQSSDITSSREQEFSSQVATGWIMVLYSTSERRDWGSQWRCVAFARMPLDSEEEDCLTPTMYWDDMCTHFDNVVPDSVGGTVTVTRNTSFGTMDSSSHAGCEIRASWTPLADVDGMDAGKQIVLWSRFINSAVHYSE